MKKVTIEKRSTTFFIPALDLMAVWNAISKEEIRYYLSGVYVESGPAGEVNLVATDGHILLRKIAPTGAFVGQSVTTQSDSHNAGFILSVDVMEKAFKVKPTGSLWVYGDSDTGILEFLDVTYDSEPAEGVAYDRLGVCEFSRVDGTFPDWRCVLLREDAEGAPFMCFDPQSMEKLFKAGRVYGLFNSAVKISTAGTSDPIRVEFAIESDLLGVIMPTRF